MISYIYIYMYEQDRERKLGNHRDVKLKKAKKNREGEKMIGF